MTKMFCTYWRNDTVVVWLPLEMVLPLPSDYDVDIDTSTRPEHNGVLKF